MKFCSAPGHTDGNKIEVVSHLCSVALTKTALPAKQEPSLDLSETISIKDPHAILIYLSTLGGSLYPEDSQVLIDSWLEVIETHYKVPFTLWTSPYFTPTPPKEEILVQASKDCKALLKDLDGSLKKSQFLAGDFLSIADISLASELFHAFRLVVDENTRKGFKSVVEWFLRVSQGNEFKAVWGEIELCKTVVPVQSVVVSEGKQEVKKVQPKKEKKPKESVQIDKEEQAKKQQERKEKKEREALAKLEAEKKKKEEESKKKEEEEKVQGASEGVIEKNE